MNMWLICFFILPSLPWEQASGFSVGVVKGQENIILKEKKKLKRVEGFQSIIPYSFNWVYMLLIDKSELGLVLKH